MIAVVQRVKRARCTVDDRETGSIGEGLVVFLGCGEGDDEDVLGKMVQKILRLRIFEDGNGKMNLSVLDSDGGVLFISQFTLSADVYHGNRPSFDSAESPDKAEMIYESAVRYLREKGIRTETGVFGAHMEISYINDGPVTFCLDSACFPGKS